MHPILADGQRLRLYVLAWGLVGVMLGLLVHALNGTPWVESLAFGLPMGLMAAPVSLSAWYLCRALPVARTQPARLAVTAVAAALVTSALWAAIGQLWWQVLGRAGFDLMSTQVPGRFVMLIGLGLGALAYLLSVTVHYVLQAFDESAAAARRALESQIAHRDAELRALRAQVDPHFLFNSLNSISGLIASDAERARHMCQLLGDFLRDSLTLGASARIPLSREVALAEQYLQVEQVRFGRRLTLRTSVTRESADVAVPPLILQPLVENAVRHGIATCLDGGTVEIAARRAGPLAVIDVRNPRDPDGGRPGTGFGLDIVRRRLGASFGDRAALVVEPAADAYRVSITLPIEEPV